MIGMRSARVIDQKLSRNSLFCIRYSSTALWLRIWSEKVSYNLYDISHEMVSTAVIGSVLKVKLLKILPRVRRAFRNRRLIKSDFSWMRFHWGCTDFPSLSVSFFRSKIKIWTRLFYLVFRLKFRFTCLFRWTLTDSD